MKICLIAEGSYPYITGGVSSWIQTLMTSLPEYEFIIYTIGAQVKSKGKFKYDLPNNLVEIKEVFLDAYLAEMVKTGKNYHLDIEQKAAIGSILDVETTNWNQLFRLFTSRKTKIDSVTNFMHSKDIFDIIQDLGSTHYPEAPFTALFWSARAMLLPLFWLLKNPPPEADIYHSVATGYGGVVAAFAKYIYQKPFVLTEHGIYTREREEEIIKAEWIKGSFKNLWIYYFNSLSHCAYTHADQVISLFTKNKEIQIDIGCPLEKISVIPNGINTADFESLPQKTREEESHIHIGAVVRLVPIKDIKTMLQSFALVKQEVPTAIFYIFGPYDEDPEYFAECLQLVDSLGLQDVYFTGGVNIKEHIGRMDILVLSSISEGQPLALLEGMASSKPFVCTDVGCCRELIYGLADGIGPAGYIVPVMHEMEMAQALITLAGDPQLRRMMGVNGQRRVATYYTKDRFISQYKNIYEKARIVQWQELVSNSEI